MERSQLEHVIRAAADATGEMEIVVVGSQAILGSVPDPPDALTQSMEADVFPRRYYAHGVGPETIKGGLE